MKLLRSPRVKLDAKSPRKIKSTQTMETMVTTSISGAKESQGLKMTRRSQQAKSYQSKR